MIDNVKQFSSPIWANHHPSRQQLLRENVETDGNVEKAQRSGEFNFGDDGRNEEKFEERWEFLKLRIIAWRHNS